MPVYRIAVIIAGIDQSYQSAILNGISASATECSINVEAFISFIGSMGNPVHDTGEFNIFNLPDFKNYDGAILLTNTIDYPPVVESILNRIKEAGIPAVSMDNDIPELYHIGIDNKKAMRKITEHMIKKHGFTRFSYISGPADNPESADRLNSFREVLSENNISIDEKNIFYGDFRSPSGKSGAEYFLKTWTELPDAVICANDVMAVSAINRLTEAGYRVPEDIAVTGFDNTYNSHNYQIEITSVDRPLELSGQLACKMLFNHFNNIPQERSIILDMSARFTESCGCSAINPPNLNDFREFNYHNYTRLEKSHSYMSLFNHLSCVLLGSNTYEQYIECLKNFVGEIRPEEFYFCLCENWNAESLTDENSYQESEDAPIPSEYTENIIVPISYKQGIFYDSITIKKSDVLPPPAKTVKSGRFYYLVPLHFGTRCLGYMAILNPRINLHNSMFETLCINISNSLENIRKLMCLNTAVKHLRKLYAQDTFSGIYNRNGFINATREIYNNCIAEQRDIMLMFIDLDGLKGINDTFGHDVGDVAICNIADVLRISCTENEIYCRFGGDEFIVFASDYGEHDAIKLTQKIENNIKKINDTKLYPFELNASTGYIIARPKQNEGIFHFVTEADKVMYKQKRRKKLSKYLKS
ncbi:MAG: GGDEF domain-containing protein [Ruminococcus flavefaciens]|nr:GGDEF domain-containing protein [Ruminococcus flavefaciens]